MSKSTKRFKKNLRAISPSPRITKMATAVRGAGMQHVDVLFKRARRGRRQP